VTFRGLIASLRALVAMPDQVGAELRDIEHAVQEVEKAAQQASKGHDADREALRSEVAALRGEVHERLLQYHLQLGRLSALVDGDGSRAALGGRVPVSVPRAESDGSTVAGAGVSRPESGATDEWLDLNACPACRTEQRTIVCEWNKLALLDTAPDEEASRYDYAVCHGCGILYATRRPFGARYRFLVDNFEDVIDKDARNPLLNPYPLTDEDRERYRKLLARGVFASDHEKGEYIDVFKDRMENAQHIELLGSLLDLNGARVLEVRPRTGTILQGLRRLYQADVYAMPIWESQAFIMQELYQIPTSSLIDFDRFCIPYRDPFDLIVCNHMFNHSVRLDVFLAAVRGALKPGGHLYLYNEIDDSEFLDGGQSMIATMNPLHMQASDTRSFARAVAASGFETVFVKGRGKRNLCLMRKTDAPVWTRITHKALDRRISAYRRARDRAVLRAPERVRHRFADVWPATVERAVASGVARFDDRGQLRIVKD
jgi:SAM-dependent methyltransferase